MGEEGMDLLNKTIGRFLTAEEVKNGAKAMDVTGLSEEQFSDGARICVDGTYAGRARSLVLSARNGKFLRSFLKATGASNEQALVGGKLHFTTVLTMFRGEARDSIQITQVELRKGAPARHK